MSTYTYKGLSFSPPPASVTLKLPCTPALNGGKNFIVYSNVVPNVTVIDTSDPITINHIENRSKDVAGQPTFTKIS